MRFAIIPVTCSTKLPILTTPQIFSGDIPFKDISGWLSLRSNVVKYAKRPVRPQLQLDIGREFDDKLWNLIEECWSQEPSNRPTAATVSLRLGGVNGCLVNPAEMYKKEIASLTEELTRVKAARQELETELASRELEKAELKKELDEERDLRKQVEKNADKSMSARQYLERKLARRELEQAELKKDLDEERLLRKQLETDANELRISILRTHGPGVSPSEPMAIAQKPNVQVEKSPSIPNLNGNYVIKNRSGNIYWTVSGQPCFKMVYFRAMGKDISDYTGIKVNEHSPTIQVLNLIIVL